MNWNQLAHHRAFRILPALLLAVAGAASLSAAPWRKLTTPRFTIVTHASDGLTRLVASDFDDFIGFLNQIIIVDSKSLKPLTIVLFADDSEFDPYKPVTADGRNIDYIQEELVNVYTSSNTGSRNGWTVIAMAGQDYERQTRHAVFYGGVAWYLDGLGVDAPQAVRHGTAAMLSTFKRGITHGEIGIVPPLYVRILDQWPLMPVNRLLAMTSEEAVLGDNRVLFSVESWAFAHYLMFSKVPMQRHAFSCYWQALRDGSSPQQALAKALGPEGTATIDFDLRAYIHSTRYVLKVPLGEEIDNKDPIVPADPMEVEIALAKAAMITRSGGGLAHAEAAVAAANGRPEAYDIRAEVLAASRPAPADPDQAVADALAHGSRSAWTVWRSASSQLRHSGGAGASPAEARAVVNLAERAANLDHRFRPAFDLLAQALEGADHVTDDDAKFLVFARSHFPSDRWILVGAAAICAKKGDSKGASRLRELALAEDGGLNPYQLPEVKKFLSGARKAGRGPAPAAAEPAPVSQASANGPGAPVTYH